MIELFGRSEQVNHDLLFLTVPVNDHRDFIIDGMRAKDLLELRGRGDFLSVKAHNPIARFQTGLIRAATLDDLNKVDTGCLAVLREVFGNILKTDIEHRTAGDMAMRGQIVNDRCDIGNWDRKTQSLDTGLRLLGIDDTDEFALYIEQAAARVARVDGRICLQQGHRFIFNGDFTANGGNDAGRHGSTKRS